MFIIHKVVLCIVSKATPIYEYNEFNKEDIRTLNEIKLTSNLNKKKFCLILMIMFFNSCGLLTTWTTSFP